MVRLLRPMLHKLTRGAFVGWLAGASLATLALLPKPVQAAEQIRLTLSILELTLSLDSLETYAETGELTGDLRFYARFLNEQEKAELRQFLQQRFDVSPQVVSQIFYSQIGERALQELGEIVRTDTNRSGFSALRGAFILAASDPDGLTVLNVIRRYPSYSIRLNGEQLLALRQEFVTLLNYRDAAVEAIAQESATSATTNPVSIPTDLPDVRLPGPNRVLRRTLEFRRDRQTLQGTAIERPFDVDLFLPIGRTDAALVPAPVVVVSHGLGSTRGAFSYLGEHLASHGFAVVIPDHIGSGEQAREALLSGILGSEINPVEFIDRPLDIQYTLDELERRSQSDPSLQGRMDLQQVGVIGHSFGGYTALALAGASLNIPRLRQVCEQPIFSLNAAPILQCTANRLPQFSYPLADPRVRAAVAISPITSVALGPESMGQIEVPTFILAGSNDFIASVVPEQIHPFLWLNAPTKYLALMVPSGHTSADNTPTDNVATNELGELLSGPDPRLGREYIRALTLAFMQTHLANRTEYADYLTSSYAQSISQDPLTLNLVRSLTAEQIETAYGGPAPIPVIPALPNLATPTANPTRDQIAETGVLNVAIRSDAPPFGQVNASGNLTGFCTDLLNAFAADLTQQLERPVQVQAIASTLDNRFELVRDRTVQVECGPNSIRTNGENVAFSTPFFLTGTHLLIRAGDTERVNPFSSLRGIRIGVQADSVTQQFLQQRYPEAQVIGFDGVDGRRQGVDAFRQGAIDTFASDGILLLAEASRQNLPASQVRLAPDIPLTCDPYGMILPEGDREWEATVNQFIGTPAFQQVWDRWFGQELYPYIFLNLDFCATDPSTTSQTTSAIQGDRPARPPEPE